MSTPERNADSLRPVTRGELDAALAPIRHSITRVEDRLEHTASKADVERMGRIMTMWVIGTMVALVGAVVALLIAFRP